MTQSNHKYVIVNGTPVEVEILDTHDPDNPNYVFLQDYPYKVAKYEVFDTKDAAVQKELVKLRCRISTAQTIVKQIQEAIDRLVN